MATKKIVLKTDIWQCVSKDEGERDVISRPHIRGNVALATDGMMMALVPLEDATEKDTDCLARGVEAMDPDDFDLVATINVKRSVKVMKAITPSSKGVDNWIARLYIRDGTSPIIVEPVLYESAGVLMPVKPWKPDEHPEKFRKLIQMTHTDDTEATNDETD